MAISYDPTQKIFKLDTRHTTYLMGLTGEGYLGHIYYGARLGHSCGREKLDHNAVPFPSVFPGDKNKFMNSFSWEYPAGGTGDDRESCLDIRDENGCLGCELFFDSFRIIKGKPALDGLPSSFGTKDEVCTLIIYMKDPVLEVEVQLWYSVFAEEDIITRSVMVCNKSHRARALERVLSACIDMENKKFSMISLPGAWARERHIQQNPVAYGRQNVSSVCGVSGHQQTPFFALASPGTNQEQGEVYAMNFVYSGNFLGQTERSQFDDVRMMMGIHPWQFRWLLKPGDSFTAPEVVLTYSARGYGAMTRSFHDFYRKHLIHDPYAGKDRPVLLNSWEAVYFDYDYDKLVGLAREAKQHGMEMLVVDDGWFGHRNDDSSSLGDWYANEEKLPGGIRALSSAVHQEGLKFGIWIEPEMISPDSDLYRAHPDYAIRIPGREPGLTRNQLVLDLTRKDVRDTICNMLFKAFDGAGIDYVKWDMNRYLSDIGSSFFQNGEQGEIYHRYVLGLYEMQARLLDKYPGLLLENCSSGGARFDPGMLYFSPQIWASDDTDAVERLHIQEGTALVYPLSCIGAHVSKCPNDQVGRSTSMAARVNMAFSGTFGYEMDPERQMTADERACIPVQIARYHRYHHIVSDGDYYRLESWREDRPRDVWESVLKDQSEAVVTLVQVLGRPNQNGHYVCLRGLNPDAMYHITEYDENMRRQWTGYGDELMEIGIYVPELSDFQSRFYYLRKAYHM